VNDTSVTVPEEAESAATLPFNLLIAETIVSEEVTDPVVLKKPTSVFPTTIVFEIVGLGNVPDKSPPADIPAMDVK
jgi:hypothetical protein